MDCCTMFSDSIWTDTCPAASSFTNTFSNIKTEAIPTPPHSPSAFNDDFFDIESSFTTSDLVNPNSILDVVQHRSSNDSLNFLNMDFPLLEDIDIKMENLEPYLGDDFSLQDAVCHHGFGQGFCGSCVDETFKTEILNDCMWASGSTPAVEVKKLIPTLNLSSSPIEGGIIYPRTHLDSNASKFSDIVDPLVGAITSLNSGVEFPSPQAQLETPSESSDTDEDADETHPHVESVHLDHNYHLARVSSHHHKEDISSPLMKALHKVSVSQTDSDDEIDVVNLSSNETIDLEDITSSYRGSFSFTSSEDSDSAGGVLMSVNGPVKRGRKPGSTGRRVGRPSKGVKRLSPTKVNRNHMGRRYGSRAIEMDPQKRNLHNSMERMRRVNLRNCFDAVRCAVPALRDRSRAPKVLILKSAVDMVKNLERGELRKRMEVERLKQYQAALMLKLQRLKNEQELG